MLKLTPKQKNEIWGVGSPYSEANLIIQHRILDDSVSRIFIDVEVHINPLTYRTIKKYRKKIADDVMIQQLLDHADYRGLPHGYVISAFSKPYSDSSVLAEAYEHLEYAQKTIIKMHQFVIEHFSKK